MIHVICHQPHGMHRAGHFNKGHKAHPEGDHTPEQLRELLADPHHTVVVGELLTEEHIAAIEAKAAKAKPKA
ncbi:MAG TPA: hypothetical protein PLO69_11080 [Gammaproteobacteria bacterium]|nr:hypothetical protein [Gammaproteobacteria bacterium]